MLRCVLLQHLLVLGVPTKTCLGFRIHTLRERLELASAARVASQQDMGALACRILAVAVAVVVVGVVVVGVVVVGMGVVVVVGVVVVGVGVVDVVGVVGMVDCVPIKKKNLFVVDILGRRGGAGRPFCDLLGAAKCLGDGAGAFYCRHRHRQYGASVLRAATTTSSCDVYPVASLAPCCVLLLLPHRVTCTPWLHLPRVACCYVLAP